MVFNRRTIFVHTGFMGLGWLVGCKTVGADASGVSAVRRSGGGGRSVQRKKWVEGSDAAHQAQYIEAVRLLKANDAGTEDGLKTIDPNDPSTYLTWRRLIEIHDQGCSHGHWNLLPWHRLYLLYFEAACQYVLNDPTFGVPYWDWTESPSVPAEFYTNPILMPPPDTDERTLAQGASLGQDIISQAVLDTIFAETDFIRVHGNRNIKRIFKGPPPDGRIEHTVHNGVHNNVGGWMANSRMSPTDPIFWLHHSNIDRVWLSWQTIHNTDLGYLKEELTGVPNLLTEYDTTPAPLSKYYMEIGSVSSEAQAKFGVAPVKGGQAPAGDPADYLFGNMISVLPSGTVPDSGLPTLIPAIASSAANRAAANHMTNNQLVDIGNLPFSYDKLSVSAVQTSIKLVDIPKSYAKKAIDGASARIADGRLYTQFSAQSVGLAEAIAQFKKSVRAKLIVRADQLPFPATDELRRRLVLRFFLVPGDGTQASVNLADKNAFASKEYLGYYAFFVNPNHHAAKGSTGELSAADFDASDSLRNQIEAAGAFTVVAVPFNRTTNQVEASYFAASRAVVTLSVEIPA